MNSLMRFSQSAGTDGGARKEHRFTTCAASGTPIPLSRLREKVRRDGFPPAAQVENLCSVRATACGSSRSVIV
jgi:hypothetical protein